MKLKILTAGLSVFFAAHLYADPLMHNSTPSENEYARKINQAIRYQPSLHSPVGSSHVPVEDDAQFAYVLLSAEDKDINEVEDLRRLIASNLPNDVKLVVLTTVKNMDAVRNRYSNWIDPNRLILATDTSTDNRNGFWARDSFPIPVRDTKTNTISLIAHQYFRPFESFGAIAKSVSAKFIVRNEIFVGGNLLADKEGNCFSVDSIRLYDMSAEEIKNIYGCKTIYMFNHVAGIGDIDEVIKPLGNKIMLTNQPEYVPLLNSLGYGVVMLPQIKDTYRTYINSLVVDKTVFMPIFGIAEDHEAQKIYEDLGYKVVPIKSNYLSDNLAGSIHCQTMAYPAIEEAELLRSLGLYKIQ